MSRREPTVNDVIRVGRVSAVFPERGTATVMFPDRDGLVSKELAIAQRGTLRNKDESWVDPGEHVICAFFGNGLSEGVILCAIYDKKNPPVVGNPDIRVTTYEDGTRVSVNRKNHIVEIKDSYGSYIRFAEGHIYIMAAANIYLN